MQSIVPSIQEIRAQRRAEGIAIEDLSQRSGIEKTRISRLENQKLEAEEPELFRLQKAIDDVVATRRMLRETAKTSGLSLIGVRL